MDRDAWRAKGQQHLEAGRLRRALGAFRRALELDLRGDQSFQLHQLCDVTTQVLSHRGLYFLHPSDETLRHRRLAQGTLPGEQPALHALATEVHALGHDELAACLRAQTLRAGLAGLDLTSGLPPEVSARARDAQLWLYEALLDREEPVTSG